MNRDELVAPTPSAAVRLSVLVVLLVILLQGCGSSSGDGTTPERKALSKAEKKTLAVKSVHVTFTRTVNGVADRQAEATWQAPDRLLLERNGERLIFVNDLAFVGLPTGLFEMRRLDNSNTTGRIWHFPVPDIWNLSEWALSVSGTNGEFHATLDNIDKPGIRQLRVVVVDNLIRKVVTNNGAVEDTYDLDLFNAPTAVEPPPSQQVQSSTLCGRLSPSSRLDDSRQCATGLL
jgi:hypothetical protein